MARNNNDWTDELRDIIEGVELTPSEGGWDRLKADLHPRRAAWWAYAVPAAACLLLGGVFLFKEHPSGNVLDVASAEPAAMVAEAARVEIEPSMQPEDASVEGEAKDLMAEEVSETVSSGISSVLRNILVATTDGNSWETPLGASPEGSLTTETGSLTTEEVSETVPPSATEEGGPLAVGSAKQTSSGTSSVAEINPLPPFDFEEEPAVRQRKQRRKITVTVSAGGMFGSAGNGLYIAQATPSMPVTKAEAGRVMDITEVIQHSTPVQKAIGLSVPLSDKMDIGTGIDHLELNSVIGPGSQNLEWVGVPLRLGFNIASWGPSSINLGAGFKGEKCLSATLLGMDYNEPFQWSANMGADLRVRIFGPVSFSFVPELSYYFTDTVLPTYRTGHPLTFTLHAGISFNL